MNDQNYKILLRNFSVACFVIIWSCVAAYASQQEADALWIEADGIRHEIFFSNFTEGQWSDPVQLTNDRFDNLHPVIDRDKHGVRWVFWTAADNGSLSLHYMTAEGKDWSDAQELPVELHSSIAPSVVVDDRGVLWLVWAGNSGGQDDIYYLTYTKGEWSDAATVHAKNEVPDILPRITLDGKNLRVTWKTFENGSYQSVTSLWNGSQWSTPQQIKETVKSAQQVVEEEPDISLPDFLKDNDRAFVRIY